MGDTDTPNADALAKIVTRVREAELMLARLRADRNTLLYCLQAVWRERASLPDHLAEMVEAALLKAKQ